MRGICAITMMGFLASCGPEALAPGPNDAVSQHGRGARDLQRAQANGSIFDLFKGGDANIKVNRYLWTASLDVLNFLPIQAADPFTGVISTGFGTPPGGGPAYRATILISDPALDARSLNVSLSTQRGPVAAGTQRAVEDAILSRARQLRIQAGKY